MKKLVRSVKFWVFLILAGVLIFEGTKYWHRRTLRLHYEECSRQAREYQKKYASVMYSELPKCFKSMRYCDDSDILASSSFSVNSVGREIWLESVTITLYLQDTFDTLTDNSQYDYLCDFAQKGITAIDHTLKYKLKDYQNVREEYLDAFYKYKDSFVSVERKYDYFVKTSKNTYQYAHNVKDYFVLNDRDHFTQKHWEEYRKKQGKTQTEKKKYSLPSGKFDYGDPYNVQDYDDPEDFYEDHEDEFDDIEEAEDYFDEYYGL